MAGNLSATMRDYLVEIYRLSEGARVVFGDAPATNNDFVTTSALADLLDVSAPAVNRMVTRLREMGLVEHEPYQGIRLTPAGKREALKELRRHRIAESFLVEVMGFDWQEVDEEADRMAAAMSDKLTERMLEMAGNPSKCPHGEPIPTADGTLPGLEDFLLSTAEAGTDLQITRIRTRERDRLEYLTALGLLPGTVFQLLHVAPFNGPMQLKLADEYRIVGYNLAELIWVKKATENA
jgi:DtxR family transcriptional regulator, Mn-dependent transcriptional regulator